MAFRKRKSKRSFRPSGVLHGKAQRYAKTPTTLVDDLQGILVHAEGRPLSVGAIMDLLSMRGHVLLLAFFSLPLCLPIGIPVVSTVFGTILIILTWFLIFNRHPWLPDRVRERMVPYASMEKLVRHAMPYVKWVELRLKHRLPALSDKGLMLRIHAFYMFLLALVVSVPMVTNMPAAIPILLLSLGLLKRDGLFIIAAYAAGIPCIFFYGGLTFLGTEGIKKLIGWL